MACGVGGIVLPHTAPETPGLVVVLWGERPLSFLNDLHVQVLGRLGAHGRTDSVPDSAGVEPHRDGTPEANRFFSLTGEINANVLPLILASMSQTMKRRYVVLAPQTASQPTAAPGSLFRGLCLLKETRVSRIGWVKAFKTSSDIYSKLGSTMFLKTAVSHTMYVAQGVCFVFGTVRH